MTTLCKEVDATTAQGPEAGQWLSIDWVKVRWILDADIRGAFDRISHPEIPKSVAMLLKKQKGKCARCGLVLTTEDIWENDHIDIS